MDGVVFLANPEVDRIEAVVTGMPVEPKMGMAALVHQAKAGMNLGVMPAMVLSWVVPNLVDFVPVRAINLLVVGMFVGMCF
jgi:hypothetical protein